MHVKYSYFKDEKKTRSRSSNTLSDNQFVVYVQQNILNVYINYINQVESSFDEMFGITLKEWCGGVFVVELQSKDCMAASYGLRYCDNHFIMNALDSKVYLKVNTLTKFYLALTLHVPIILIHSIFNL